MTKRWRAQIGRSVPVVFFALFAVWGLGFMFFQVASASASPPALDVSPAGNLSDGQTITVGVGANNYFTPHSGVNILECADPGGTEANLPKDDTTCDGNTIQGISILVANDGSFSDSTYQVYMLPSQVLGEQANFTPVCNQTNYCVLYVGQNQNDFTAPKVFSAPFLISPSAGSTTTTVAAGTSASSGGSGPFATAAAPPVSTTASVAATASSGTLANTGAPAQIAWVAALGGALLLTGIIGRRRVLRWDR